MTTPVFSTPVLLITYNRPESTRRVFESIRKIKPVRLYFAADGARKGIASDVLKCRATRQILDTIDWDCQVERLFRNENLGPNLGVFEAIKWFFSNESEGIVLEDDCLPSGDFFHFSLELLERFRDDNRVMHIGGSNFLSGWHHEEYDYYFSRNGHIAGWATWRRAWDKLCFDSRLYRTIKSRGFFDELFVNRSERRYWLGVFDRLDTNEGPKTHWFQRWTLSRFIHSGLAIVPRQNLIADVNTSTDDYDHSFNSIGIQGFYRPLLHPPFVIRDMESDKQYYSKKR